MLSCLPVVWGCVYTTTGELSSYDRDQLAHLKYLPSGLSQKTFADH